MDVAMKAMMAELAPVIRDFVAESFTREIAPLKEENAALRDRIASLEERQPEKGEPGEKGADGVSPEPEAIIEACKDILDSTMKEMLDVAVSELPPPPQGEKGDQGERGLDGVAPEPEAIAELLNERLKTMVAEAVSALPPPEKGEPGEKGDTGERGADGQNGADGIKGDPGRDAANIVEALKDSGELVLTLQDGRLIRTGIRDGEKGSDGRDGFGFDDMDACVLDDDRTIELSFRRGDEEKAFTFKWPSMVYRGVWSEGTTYQPGDVVTWGGSAHVAERETDGKPDTKDSGFRLAVKRGRDGKDGKGG